MEREARGLGSSLDLGGDMLRLPFHPPLTLSPRIYDHLPYFF